MRAYIDSNEYLGTPEEISTFLSLQATPKYEEPGDAPGFDPDDFLPVISDSEDLRRKLAEDANYNPHGGVLPPKDSEPDIDTQVNTFTAEENTGVTLA